MILFWTDSLSLSLSVALFVLSRPATDSYANGEGGRRRDHHRLRLRSRLFLLNKLPFIHARGGERSLTFTVVGHFAGFAPSIRGNGEGDFPTAARNLGTLPWLMRHTSGEDDMCVRLTETEGESQKHAHNL